MRPLAEIVRPKNIEDVIGQKHILGENRLLSNLIKSNHIPNMIFYGPPGTGKTTVANIIANSTNKKLYKLNATDSSIKDIKEIINSLNTLLTKNGVLLYLDEIQNFNKKQQQSLLKFMENGQITLIASTTENPYFTIFGAIISRSTIFEFKKLTSDEILVGLEKAIKFYGDNILKVDIDYNKDALSYICDNSGGDLRRALTNLELAINSNKNLLLSNNFIIDLDTAKECTQTNSINYDRFGDNHYDILSAFQKSIRGSDPDASIHYLAKLIKVGDLNSITRRLLVIASEDIGLAYPNAISIVNSCVESAYKLGFPEARIPLSQAVLLLATCPKSNSVISAIDSALNDIDSKDVGDVPLHLKDSHYKNSIDLKRGVDYKFPHDYPNNYVKQEYLPKQLIGRVYYKPSNNKFESKINEYLNDLKNK